MIRRLVTIRGLIIDSVTFGSIMTCAEFTQMKIQQWRSKKSKEKLDYWSLGRYTLVGSVVIAPILHTYYCILDNKLPGTANKIVALKVGSDVIFANIAYYFLFYYCLSYLEHWSHEKALKDAKDAFGFSYLAGKSLYFFYL